MEESAYECQVAGYAAVGAPQQFETEKFGYGAAEIESAGFKRRPYAFRISAGDASRPRASPFRTVKTPSGVSERASAIVSFHIEKLCFEPQAFGAEKPQALVQEQSALGRIDFRDDEQCRCVAGQVGADVEIEGRTSPTVSV